MTLQTKQPRRARTAQPSSPVDEYFKLKGQTRQTEIERLASKAKYRKVRKDNIAKLTDESSEKFFYIILVIVAIACWGKALHLYQNL